MGLLGNGETSMSYAVFMLYKVGTNGEYSLVNSYLIPYAYYAIKFQSWHKPYLHLR